MSLSLELVVGCEKSRRNVFTKSSRNMLLIVSEVQRKLSTIRTRSNYQLRNESSLEFALSDSIFSSSELENMKRNRMVASNMKSIKNFAEMRSYH